MEELKFEKAVERLEKIVEFLEGGDVALDEALKKYEEGVKLSRLCSQKLAQAEKKIEILTRTLNGALTAQPFDIEEAEKSEKNEKKEKKAKKESSSADGSRSRDSDLDEGDKGLLF